MAAGGRKSKYQEDFPLRAEGLAREGLTDRQIAAALGISLRVYYTYQEQYPQFRQSIARGKAPVDTEVENALLKRALGYEITERTIETDADGKPIRSRVVRKTIIPDVRAQEVWLYNRRPDRWQARPDNAETPAAAKPVEEASRTLAAMAPEERAKHLEELLKEGS